MKEWKPKACKCTVVVCRHLVLKISEIVRNHQQLGKIKTDILSVKNNLMEAIEIPPEITHSARGVRKRANPLKSLNPITLERVDQESRMNPPDAPLLRECTKIQDRARRYKKIKGIGYKNACKYSDIDSVFTFTLHSKLHISLSSDVDSEEDFTNRLQELEMGTKLRRKSTMVSTLGFKPKSSKLPLQRRTSIVSKFPIVRIPMNAMRKNSCLSPIKEDDQRQIEFNDKVYNLLKICNKRKIDPEETAGEALLFLNQLGRKLLVKQQHIVNNVCKHGNIENLKIESVSSNFSLSSQEETGNTSLPKGMMSPIKTRKQILNTNLNCEQKNTLNLWRAYKAGDQLSMSSDNSEGKRNSSQTPEMRAVFFPKASPNAKLDDAKSCRKLSSKKSKKKRRVKTKKPKGSKKGKKNAEAKRKNMVYLSQKVTSGEQSPKKRRVRRKVKTKQTKVNHPCSSIVENLNDILNNMDNLKPIEETKFRKPSIRKMSCEIIGENEITSPKKSPRKSPRKQRTKRRLNSKRSIKKLPKNKEKNAKNNLKTMMDISMIVANLDEVLADEDSKEPATTRASMSKLNSQNHVTQIPAKLIRFGSMTHF
ncbi:unnamed protein product [Moneuplotes crassus]|uniref:Uncharacterized protein n=1 Tax=Euplotes crassus TaxID=5936 RepID=A0AAD2D5X2_EUPCR|nr:unnamed protein product [Moneuplotes crassus]